MRSASPRRHICAVERWRRRWLDRVRRSRITEGAYRPEAECQLRLDGSRLLTAPRGLAGGHPGGRGSFQFGDGIERFVDGAGSLRAGETVEIVTPGAGGYGPPAERDPAMVERDLADQRIDLASAAATYPRSHR